ncbi:hypothetical protein [Methylorubrum extorquens]|uniref:hypothetical protein n=1 Tax=Methylorubrum extorquens TaxID=408 RepID=UPI0013016379|nr:hypothetical protein [Methylorubrum extorquens]MCP1591981.1 DNA invertase Pin-like site-specific DNA recombinase [Methylorubrum extorquens]
MKAAAERLAAADAAAKQEPSRPRISAAYRGPGQSYDRNAQRLDEHERFILDLCDGPCTTDDADMHLRPMLPHLAAMRGGFDAEDFQRATHRLCARLFPNLPADVIDGIIEEGRAGKLRFLRADQYGQAIGLTAERRKALDIRRIGACDRSKTQRARDRKTADRNYQRDRRAAAGATPRGNSKKAMAAALGISYATLKRRIKAGIIAYPPMSHEPLSSAIGRSPPITPTEVAQASSQPISKTGPARTGGASQNAGADVHAHGARTRAVPAGRAVVLPFLPGEEVERQGDLISTAEAHAAKALEIIEASGWAGGPMAADLRQAVRDAARVRGTSRQELADAIGISRQQVTNSLRPQGTDGFGRNAAANLKAWLQRQAGAG